MHVVIDIKTRRDQEFLNVPEVEEAMRANLKVGNRKDLTKIAQYQEESWLKMIERAAQDPLTGKIAAIGVANLHDEEDPVVIAGSDEDYVIGGFKDWLDDVVSKQYVLWCGWRIRTFEIPFIGIRAAVHYMPLYGGWPTRKWDGRVIDISEVLEADRSMMLETWLARFGIPAGESLDVESASDVDLTVHTMLAVNRERMLLRRLEACYPMLRPPRGVEGEVSVLGGGDGGIY